MVLEVSRLLVGILIAIFHQNIADFITERDMALVAMFRRRGVVLPSTIKRETAHTLYFSIGIFVAMYEILRIWLLYR